MSRAWSGPEGRVDKFDNGRKGLRCAPHRCVSVVMEGSTPTSSHFPPSGPPEPGASVSRIRGSARLPSPCRCPVANNFQCPRQVPAKIPKSSYRDLEAYQRASFDCTHAPSDLTLPVLIKPQRKRMQPVVVIASGPRYQSINRIAGTRCIHFAVWLLRVRRIRQSYDTSSPIVLLPSVQCPHPKSGTRRSST